MMMILYARFNNFLELILLLTSLNKMKAGFFLISLLFLLARTQNHLFYSNSSIFSKTKPNCFTLLLEHLAIQINNRFQITLCFGKEYQKCVSLKLNGHQKQVFIICKPDKCTHTHTHKILMLLPSIVTRPFLKLMQPNEVLHGKIDI